MHKLKKSASKKIVKHLKEDIKNFKHEAHEDKELIKDVKKASCKKCSGKCKCKKRK